MAQKRKINIKDRLVDGEVDLSLLDLEEVPVIRIEDLKKITSLDLSNNRLTTLPTQFIAFSALTKLDLSKNELTELPEQFGTLTKLKHLDLYRNKLEKLPLSFAQLTNLKFLDLKDNLLVATIAKVAGPCVDNKGCQQCARDIVKFYQQLQNQVDTEVEMRQKTRQKQLAFNQQKKQEEKKKQKKEKQKKAKKDAQQLLVQANEIDEINKPKKNSNNNNNKKEAKKSRRLSTLFMIYRWIMMGTYLLMVLLFILWIMFATKCCKTEIVGPIIGEYYSMFLEKLPPDYRLYGQRFGDKTVVMQEGLGKLLNSMASTVRSSELVRNAWAYIYSFVSVE